VVDRPGRGQHEDRGGLRASAVVKVPVSFFDLREGASGSVATAAVPNPLQTPSGGANVLSRPASHRRTATTEYLTG
jgi:hypothetical protein